MPVEGCPWVLQEYLPFKESCDVDMLKAWFGPANLLKPQFEIYGMKQVSILQEVQPKVQAPLHAFTFMFARFRKHHKCLSKSFQENSWPTPNSGGQDMLVKD